MGKVFSSCFGKKDSVIENDREHLFNEERDSDGLVYRILKIKTKRHSSFLNRFWNKKNLLYSRLNRSNQASSSSGINLQCLDARSLMMIAKDKNFAYRQELNGSECTSNYSNSLDLEWEHEYGSNTDQWLPNKDSEYLSDDGTASNYSALSNKSAKNRTNLIRRVDQNLKVNPNAISMARSGNSSRRSTPDSMEWDLDHDQLKSEVDSVDLETKELLNEIEQLKNRVLSETGEGVHVQLEKSEIYES
ncbi:uncharacterized protein LOC134831933 [Culicoides brevitarsis]|uniref:uncharacterized protein LOC134831933 n=1 Tax=Culicoides brevitarsis TaxID=469753 RepID=UPI00307C2CB3